MQINPILDPVCCLPVVGFDAETGKRYVEWKISPHGKSGDFDRDCYFLTVEELKAARAEALKVS